TAQRAGLNNVDTRRLARLAFRDYSLHQRFRYAFKMFDLDPRILFVQCFLHLSIGNRIRRSPYDDGSFFFCAGVELRDRLTTWSFALFLCVAAAHEEPHDNHYSYCSADDSCRAFTDSHYCRLLLLVLFKVRHPGRTASVPTNGMAR